MRLICPNCGAQYEVDDTLIPESGRDVQCSNCGNAWFQRPANMDPELAEELGEEPAGQVTPPIREREDETGDEADSAVETAVTGSSADAAEDGSSDESGDDEGARPAVDAGQLPEIDEGVRNILREEAEREGRARAADRGGLETQSDLGLPESPEQRSVGVRERMARLRGLDVDERAEGAAAAVAAATAAGSRRELLPDIEEINSSLRSAEERDDMLDQLEEDPQTGSRRRGFGTGFLLILLLALLAVGIYVFAERIGAAAPSLAEPMAGYVVWVDKTRLAIDGVAQDWVRKITEMLQQVNGNSE